MKIVVAGCSGLIGRPLSRELSKSHEVVTLVRKTSTAPSARKEKVWNPTVLGDWVNEVDGADAVINLSGEPIAGKRWTADQKKRLVDSRLVTTQGIVRAIEQSKIKPKVLINASAIGYYGDRNDEILDENSSPGDGFLADVCRQWETQALHAQAFGTRVVLLRTGIVLAREGGALQKMLPPFRFGLGGPLGSGKQVMSWIHIEDEVRAIKFALENESVKGPINLTAPEPVSNDVFSRCLGAAIHRPAVFPLPGLVLKLLLGEMSELLLKGQRVFPKKLLEYGFQFKFNQCQAALSALIG